MGILIGFFLPTLAYLALYILTKKKNPIPPAQLGKIYLGAALAVAAVSSLTVLCVIKFSSRWPGQTQVAWTGIEVVGQPLVIGGPLEQAMLGWPNDSYTPSMKITAVDELQANLEIAGGEAFLIDDTKHAALNGEAIPDGTSKTVGDFTIRVSRSYYLWYRVEIVDGQNEQWASFDLPAVLIKNDQVYSLIERIDNYSNEKVRSDSTKLVQLEMWARELRLLLTRQGEVRLLGVNSQQAQCAFPCQLTLRWPNRSLPIVIRKDGAKLILEYLPPRRLVSPIPPSTDNEAAKLTVTGNPVPGDTAFFIPLGHGLQDPRSTISFGYNSNGLPIFSSPGAIVEDEQKPYLPPGIQQTQSGVPEAEKGITSRFIVQSGPVALYLATISDMPSVKWVALFILGAFFCFGSGAVLVYPRMPEDGTRWTIYGLAIVLWNILLFRLLLALRYAHSPSNLDALAVKGVILALLAVIAAPGLMFLTIRLRRDLFTRPSSIQGRKNAFRAGLGYLLGLLVIGGLTYYAAQNIWLNPPLFAGSWVFSLVALISVGALVLYLFLLLFVLYKAAPTNSPAQNKFRRLIAWPLNAIEDISKVSQRLWAQVGTDASWNMAQQVAYLIVSIIIALVIIIVPLLISLAAKGASKLISLDTFVHDIIIPFIFYWPLALFWLSARIKFPPGMKLPPLRRLLKNPALRRRLSRIFLLALATILVPIFALPIFINDIGSIMGLLAIILPVCFVLLASRPRRWGGIAISTVLLGFLLVALIYANIQDISPHLPERAGVAASRLLVFKEGGNVQRYIPFASSFSGQLQRLRNGYQHTWENRAIAHEGGFMGLGFGNAPTHRSAVRQDTIQYDSVFSFFIASEHGLLGSMSLLLLYAVPLVIVLITGRRRFDFGYAVASLIASSFLLEALNHAAMNLNIFPFTGRDLPLLTVNSFTDLLRWTLLFCFVAQTILYRYRGQSDLRDDTVSLVTPSTSPPAPNVSHSEQLGRYLSAAVWILCLPAIVLASLLWVGVKTIKDTELDVPFGWNGMLDLVDRMGRDNLIIVKPDKTLEVNKLLTSPGMLIEQEIARFNALPLNERLSETDLSAKLDGVNSRAEYEQIIDEMRKLSSSEPGRHRVSLFKLLPPLKWFDGAQFKEVGGYRVIANREFNTRLSFKTSPSKEDLPHTTFRDGQGLLIGPAWVNGRWVHLYDMQAPLPWTAHLAGAFEEEWARLGKDQASKLYEKLSLDRKLQEAASKFMSERGWELHSEILKNRRDKKVSTALPPRVALAVLSLPTGEVLALGGWPHMSSSRFWRQNSSTKEWIPSVDWAEHDAPQSLRLLYGGDRNFDRLVMGSSTKPLWAAAVIKIHPDLDRRLQVKGDDSLEDEVFGIKLTDTWEVDARNWVDFKNYLAISDNRYHVRLGFLGLAEKTDSEVIGEGSSPSEKESVKGSPPAPWKKYPSFPSQINFSHLQHGPMRKLDETPLAQHLKNMYGISVTEHFLNRRISFWTKNEDDNFSLAGGETQPLSIFNAISPQIADLSLNKVELPRDFVTVLLGGGYNLWSNVDFAAAFGTCVTGNPVVVHIVKNQESVKEFQGRERFPDIAAKLRPGLSAVVTEGTANISELSSALSSLRKLPGMKIYAKTGTLSAQEGANNTSRIVLAIVQWDDEQKGIVKAGLVFSIVGERAGVKSATKWLGAFINENRSDIERLLAEASNK